VVERDDRQDVARSTGLEHPAGVRRARRIVECLADGIDVRGYFQWSLLDNFE